ncbi:MAG: histidine phosphatase family protein [Rhodothermales bacterium]
MKTLYVFRHGKSDWDAAYTHDSERPLAKRGKAASARQGRWLSEADVPPDLIYCSPSRRTRETIERASRAAGWNAPVETREQLYETDGARYLQIVRSAPAEARRLMLVGHEPMCSELIARLTGGVVRFPTAALARIDIDREAWAVVGASDGVLVWLMPARIKPA